MTTTQRERVQAHLIATGVMDEQGVTRRPRPAHCARCRHAVIAAITDAGFTVTCWPVPTTAHGELTALLAGLPTYSWHPDDGLYHRDDFRIAGNNTHRVRVLVTHRCTDAPPEPNPTWDSRNRPQAVHGPTADATPPF